MTWLNLMKTSVINFICKPQKLSFAELGIQTSMNILNKYVGKNINKTYAWAKKFRCPPKVFLVTELTLFYMWLMHYVVQP